ncbi:hypothetical protein AAEX28_00145 [Lentisphaerota bacterium WC36G]|nr:hypothetical protein LJT99_03020 [Lentisphaerae bacterium WC36]
MKNYFKKVYFGLFILLLIISSFNKTNAKDIEVQNFNKTREKLSNLIIYRFRINVNDFDKMLKKIKQSNNFKLYQYLSFYILNCNNNNKLSELKKILVTQQSDVLKEKMLKEYALAVINCRLKKIYFSTK